MKRSCDYACHSPEHKIARRQFIGTMAAGSIAGGLGVFTSSSAAEALKSQHFMKPERKQELAWKQVTKEEAYEKMKLLLPALTYIGDDGWDTPKPSKYVFRE